MAKSTIYLDDTAPHGTQLLEKEKHIKMAIKLLVKAVDLLKSAGAGPAHRSSCLALDAGQFALRKVAKLRQEALHERPKSDRPLPCTIRELMREDGTLRAIAYMKAAGRRPSAVGITFRTGRQQSMNTTFSVVDRDITEVYNIAVLAFAEHLGVASNRSLVGKMLGTREAFMKRYGL